MNEVLLTVGVDHRTVCSLKEYNHPSYPICSVNDGMEAIEFLENHSVYGIFIDASLDELEQFLMITLDVENGWPEVPVIAIDTTLSLDQVAQLTRLGVDGFYENSVASQDIILKMYELIARHIMGVREASYYRF